MIHPRNKLLVFCILLLLLFVSDPRLWSVGEYGPPEAFVMRNLARDSLSAPHMWPKDSNGDHLFIHWDLRRFSDCKVFWSAGDSTNDISPVNGEDEWTDIRNAFATWEAVTPSVIGFTEVPGVTGTPSGTFLDNKNIVGWVTNAGLGPGVIAYTYAWGYGPRGEVSDRDIVFEDTYAWARVDHDSLTGGYRDVWTVAMHEIGHFLGLDHAATTGYMNDGPIMLPVFDVSGKANHVLHLDDQRGCNFLYTPDMGCGALDWATNPRGGPLSSRTLNGRQLLQYGEGPLHLFGTSGVGDPAHGYLYEWLGDDVSGECVPRFYDDRRDGVDFKTINGGKDLVIDVTVSTATDSSGMAHVYTGPGGHNLYLNVWIDWSDSYAFEPPAGWPIEHIIGPGRVVNPTTVGTAQVFSDTIPIPPQSTRTPWARVRLDWGEDCGAVANVDGSLSGWWGAAQFGEVEDYQLNLALEYPHHKPKDKEKKPKSPAPKGADGKEEKFATGATQYLLAEYTFAGCDTAGWTSYDATSGYGDYAGLVDAVSVVQEDPCRSGSSCLWGFLNGSIATYACGGFPGQTALPYAEGGVSIENMIVSPDIDLNPGGTVPATASSVILEFDVYQDLPLEDLVYYTWGVHSVHDSLFTSLRDRDALYYGRAKAWTTVREEIGDLIEPGASHIAISLGVVDMSTEWSGAYGSGTCHGPGPLFDNVRVYRVNTAGPVWGVEDMDLFQDAFPDDGTTTGTVRTDMARDVSLATSTGIQPGDSTVVSVSEPNVGLGTDGTWGGAAVYAHVRSSGLQSGGAVTGDATRWPLVGVAGGWTTLRMDTVFAGAGRTNPIAHKYCVDLNDDLFAPPDRIDFYFSARDANGVETFWTQTGGTVSNEAAAQATAMEMQCLPTGGSDILYVDDMSGRGGQIYFDSAFEMLGITPDRYDVRAPSSIAGNGLAARAVAAQIVDTYRVIIWSSGDLGAGTIGDGTGSPGKSPDAQLLYTFLDQSGAWDPGLYISGDAVAQEMKALGGPAYQDLFGYIGYTLVSGDHVANGKPVSPLVIARAGSMFDHTSGPDSVVAVGGCPQRSDFDVLAPSGTASVEMSYGGSTLDADGAVIAQETANSNGRSARVVLSGVSFHRIGDDRAGTQEHGVVPDRVGHLADILQWMTGDTLVATGVPAKPHYTNALSQNYPNPFNPGTTIRFSIERRAHVTLRIYDAAGRLVRTLVDELRVPRENGYTVEWNGRNDAGQPVASGIYFCRVTAGDFRQTRKMVVLR